MAQKILSFRRVIPMIYAYNTPDVLYNEGWTKIGYTERQTVEERIYQQTHTAGIRAALAWKDNAMYKDGTGSISPIMISMPILKPRRTLLAVRSRNGFSWTAQHLCNISIALRGAGRRRREGARRL